MIERIIINIGANIGKASSTWNEKKGERESAKKKKIP